jgi:hypothetical protein
VNRSCFLSVAACRTPRNPWDMQFPSVSGTCEIVRCSPQSVPFPPRPPPRLAPHCSAGSSVLRHSPTSPARACPPFALWAPRTGLDLSTKSLFSFPVGLFHPYNMPVVPKPLPANCGIRVETWRDVGCETESAKRPEVMMGAVFSSSLSGRV